MRAAVARRRPATWLCAGLGLAALALGSCGWSPTADTPAESMPQASAELAAPPSTRPASAPDRTARAASPSTAVEKRATADTEERAAETRDRLEPELAAPSFAEPASVAIPAIDVKSPLIRLGLDDQRRLEVPEGDQFDLAGWYREGPRPGERGPAVVAGHVDSVDGPSVFYELAALQKGDEVQVTDERGEVIVFVVDDIEQVGKAAFPTEDVYGDTDGPELRLITCGGAFDDQERSYADNVIVYASLAD